MNAAYTQLFSQVLFPLQERVKGHDTAAVRRWLERTQWWPRQDLEQLRVTRLRHLLEHAGRHVPYYRRLFRERGFNPASVRGTADLARLPLLDKAPIRAEPEAFKSERARSLSRFNTGGSSGEPLIFWIGKERVSHDVAAKWRATRWWGVDFGDPEVVLWGSPIELGSQDWIKLLRDRVQRSLLLPAFEMSDEKVRDFIRAIRHRRPRMLFGYPSALAYVAGVAEREGVRLDTLGTKVAFVTAELLYDDQRERIARVFGCAVANGYGGRDAGFIAHQCPAGGMHITAEDLVVEIVDEAGMPVPDGQSGEIVVTHLATSDFPFIRYRTGDRGRLGQGSCACGRSLPLLEAIEGRATDFVMAQDGTVMHGLALIYEVRDVPGVREFKIIQEDRCRVRLMLAVEESFAASSVAAIQDAFRHRLGDGVEIVIEEVPAIPAEASGKYRYVVSEL